MSNPIAQLKHGSQMLIHILEETLRVFRTTFISLLFTTILAATALEGSLLAITRTFPASYAAQIFVIVLSLITGYSVALTYAVIRSLAGAARVVRFVDNELTGEVKHYEDTIKSVEGAILHKI